MIIRFIFFDLGVGNWGPSWSFCKVSRLMATSALSGADGRENPLSWHGTSAPPSPSSLFTPKLSFTSSMSSISINPSPSGSNQLPFSRLTPFLCPLTQIPRWDEGVVILEPSGLVPTLTLRWVSLIYNLRIRKDPIRPESTVEVGGVGKILSSTPHHLVLSKKFWRVVSGNSVIIIKWEWGTVY